MARIFRKFAQLLDVDMTTNPPADGDRPTWDDAQGKWVPGTPSGSSGAPSDATYLVTTANGDLSAEVVVGATPGGELGGTWASPTVDATHSGSSHASVQSAAEATAAAALSAHESDTTGVHGIADTSALALSAGVPSNATFNDHSARHEDGGADEISLTGLSGTPAALTTHEADTTSVHGIADTSALALTADVVTKALFDANTVLAANSDNTPAALTMGASTFLARLAAGNIKAASVSEIMTLLGIGVAVIQDQKSQNTAGGTATSGDWRTRDLNTEVIDTQSRVSVSSNQLSVLAGTYLVLAFAPGFETSIHQLRLRNVTDGADLAYGGISYAPSGQQSNAELFGAFTLAATKTVELQHRPGATRATFGFGNPGNYTTEVYATVVLVSVA